MGAETDFKQKGKSKGSALVSFWNTGKASAVETIQNNGDGAASTAGAARALAFSGSILDHERVEVVVPVTLDGQSWWT